jgi:hypothetical protein
MIARHERMRLGPGLPVFTIGMHADTARCLLQAPDHDAEIGKPPPPSAGSGPKKNNCAEMPAVLHIPRVR